MAHSGEEMKTHLKWILGNAVAGLSLSDHGLKTIWSRHTCSHRVDQLLSILSEIEHKGKGSAAQSQSAVLQAGLN
jgi:spore maturation protein CgeB